MLIMSTVADNPYFTMGVIYQKEIVVEFRDFFTVLKASNINKNIIFIDPVVLFNNDLFFDNDTLNTSVVIVPTNLHENTKDLDSLKSILDILETQGVGRRNDVVFAIGGGALLDTVAMAASVFRRGISVVKVPTTLLGIVDASIGIKTGVNYRGQRNRIGSYHFDYRVIIDPQLMQGLSRKLLRQGLGEIFKIAVIKSRTLFDIIVLHKDQLEDVGFYRTVEGVKILQLSIQLMLEELHDNPREDNLCRCVDFGHSFSPLLEMESLRRSGLKALPHGYAVAFDCMLVTTISMKRGILNNYDYLEVLKLYSLFDFDLGNEIYLDYNIMWASFTDMIKHRGGNQNQPIPIAIGSYSFIQDVTFEEMKQSAEMLREFIMK